MTLHATRRVAALGAAAAAAVTGGLVSQGGAAAAAGGDPFCRTDDGQAVSSAPVVSEEGYETGTVVLWYSPSTRCAWASAIPAREGAWSTVVLHRSDHAAWTSSGEGKLVTPAVNDAGFPAAGWAHVDVTVWGVTVGGTGKTAWW